MDGANDQRRKSLRQEQIEELRVVWFKWGAEEFCDWVNGGFNQVTCRRSTVAASSPDEVSWGRINRPRR